MNVTVTKISVKSHKIISTRWLSPSRDSLVEAQVQLSFPVFITRSQASCFACPHVSDPSFLPMFSFLITSNTPDTPFSS